MTMNASGHCLGMLRLLLALKMACTHVTITHQRIHPTKLCIGLLSIGVAIT